jgi:hypothetical protein
MEQQAKKMLTFLAEIALPLAVQPNFHSNLFLPEMFFGLLHFT